MYRDGKPLTELPELPGFGCFLDLRTEFSVSQTVLVWFNVPSSFRTLSIDRVSPGPIPQIFASSFSAIDPNGIQSRHRGTTGGLTAPL